MNMAEDQNSLRQHPLRVFISHSDVDMVAARKLRNLLVHRANAYVFTTEDLSAGEKWENKLRDQLSAADVVVALLTPTSVHSNWVLHEIGAAWALGKPIVPVITRRDVLNNMPVSLINAQAIHLTDVESNENADKFLGAFQTSLASAHIQRN
jgi:nucleoside 2-deoxyribosyltransferase